jgi:hypothetical protein
MTSQIQSNSPPMSSPPSKGICPISVTMSNLTINEDLKRYSIGNESTVKCIFCTSGCSETLKPAEVEDHQENCSYQSALCRGFNCNKMVLHLDEKARNQSFEMQMNNSVQSHDDKTAQELCPITLLEINENSTKNDQNQEHENISIRCIFCTSGCSEILKPEALEFHQENCQFQSGFCRAHNCNKILLYADTDARNQSFERQVNNLSLQSVETKNALSSDLGFISSEKPKNPTDPKNYQNANDEMNQMDEKLDNLYPQIEDDSQEEINYISHHQTIGENNVNDDSYDESFKQFQINDVTLRNQLKRAKEDFTMKEHDDVTGNNQLESDEKTQKRKNRESQIFIPCLFAKSHGCQAEIIDEDQLAHDDNCPLREVVCDVIGCQEMIPIYLLNDHFYDRHQNLAGFSSPIKLKTKKFGKFSKILKKSLAISFGTILNLFF